MSVPQPKFKTVSQADENSPLQAPLSELHKVLLLTLVAAYFFCILFWISSRGPFQDKVNALIRPVMLSFGIGQGWNLFSPDLRSVNVHMNAVITFADGSTKNYEFPRMEKLDLVGRFQKEKMRKLFVDHLAWLADEQFLPTVARYVARANLNPDNQPVLVSISKNWARMPPPDEQHWVAREQWPAHGFHDTLCTYKVKEKDLP